MKFFGIIIVLVLLVMMTACGSSNVSSSVENKYISENPSGSPALLPTATPEAKPGATPIATPIANPEQQLGETDNKALVLKEVSRSEAGLDSIEKLDFGMFQLNVRLAELLADSSLYNYHDYKAGIQLGESILITERFKGSIIDDIAIGTDTKSVKTTLGNPSFNMDGYMFYKTKDYYIGFNGSERVELAVIRECPPAYDPMILKSIFGELAGPEHESLLSAMDNNAINEFIDYEGHIHGGGWYLQSLNGINVEEFNTVTVYNNFEGLIYRPEGEIRYGISFVNIDMVVEKMKWDCYNYISTNEAFNSEGIPSPGEKYNYIYEWVYSELHYFTVRTTDYSMPDKVIHAAAFDHRWLNDNHILYTTFIYGTPMLINVDTMESTEISIWDEAGAGFESDLKIDDISDNKITFTDWNDNSVIIGYREKSDGSLEFYIQ